MLENILESVVYKAVTAIPALDGHEEFETAIDLVKRGEVSRNQADGRFVVAGRECTLARCYCGRPGVRHERLGNLCRHRLAAMLYVRAREATMDLIRNIFKNAREAVHLEVATRYAWTRDVRSQGNHLVGYRWDDRPWVRGDLSWGITFSMADLVSVLYELGWAVRAGSRLVVNRHYMGRERWTFEHVGPHRDPDPMVATRAHSLYGIDAEMASEMEFERRIQNVAVGQN